MAESNETHEKCKRSATPVNKRQKEFVFKFPSQQGPIESVCKTNKKKDNKVLPGKNIVAQPGPPKVQRKSKKSKNTFVFKFKPAEDKELDGNAKNTVVPKDILEKVKEDVRRQISNRKDASEEIYFEYLSCSSLLPNISSKEDCKEEVDLLQESPCFEDEEFFGENEKSGRRVHIEGMDLLQELPYLDEDELLVDSSQQESKGTYVIIVLIKVFRYIHFYSNV